MISFCTFDFFFLDLQFDIDSNNHFEVICIALDNSCKMTDLLDWRKERVCVVFFEILHDEKLALSKKPV